MQIIAGYSLETRRLVARSPRLAPALTQTQIRKLAPIVIVKRRPVVDESQERRVDPTIFDLAAMHWLTKWKRRNTEDLREPLPGSGLVVGGEVSLPWMQYVRAVARNQTPGALRVHRVHKLEEHTIAPCENHVMVPLGWRALSYKEILTRFVGHRYKYIPQATHIHEIEMRAVDGDTDGKYQWSCRRCDQRGFEDYTVETLARATGVVWHGCVKCSAAGFRASLSRREFFKRGLGAAAGFEVWTRGFSPLRPVPYVPPAYGAGNSFIVRWNATNPNGGDGTDASPYGSFEKARTSVRANNGDTVQGRGSDTDGARYNESFDNRHRFPSGSSYALATVVTNDGDHTPTIKPTPAAADIFEMGGSGSQYVVFGGLTLDCNGSGNFGFRFRSSLGSQPENAAHHIRVDGCDLRNKNTHDYCALILNHASHHIEVLNSALHDVIALSNEHGVYQDGQDNLVSGCDMSAISGYCIHPYNDEPGEASDRSVYRRNSAHSGPGLGIMVSCADCLCYYNYVYANSGQAASGGLDVRPFQTGVLNAKVLNNTVAGNPSGGIRIREDARSTFLRNNVSVRNEGYGDFVDGSSSTDHARGSTNSWNIPGFIAGLGTSMAAHIAAGTFPETTVKDHDGKAVPSASPDIGAFQR